MLFLTLSNIDIKFVKKKLTWRFYIANKALPIIKQVEFIEKKKFTKTALNKNFEIFVMHIAILKALF